MDKPVQAVTSQAVPISAVAVAAVTAVPVTPMTALGVPVPPGTILSANDNNNNINNNTQPVAAVPSSQQFTADELKGCWPLRQPTRSACERAAKPSRRPRTPLSPR